jgi:hypothetical protein
MTLDEASEGLRCHAAILDPAGMPLKTCAHDHGVDVHAAALCALDYGWNGAVQFKMKDGKRVRTLQRFAIGRSARGQTMRTLGA